MKNENQKEVEEIKHDISELQKGVTRILQILESDSKTNSKGLVEKVRENQAMLLEIKIKDRARSISYGILGGIITTASAILAWLIKIGITKI